MTFLVNTPTKILARRFRGRVPLNPDDPVGAYLLASKRTPDQRKDELATAAKTGTAAPGRMGKGWPAR